MNKLLIRKGRVVNPADGMDAQADIYIEDGFVKTVAPDLSELDGVDGIKVINAEGKVVVPGLIDIHCHLRDPGYEYKEDIATGTRSAAKGGFTSIACMPNTNPVTDNIPVISYILNRAKEVGAVHVFPIGAITKGLKGEEMAPIGELKFAGAVAVSDDGRPVQNGNMMKNAMIYANTFDTPVISHCEDLELADGGVMNEGTMATTMGLKGICRSSEEAMVAREIVLADATDTPVHIAHVSTHGSVELIRDAKKRGVKVTCETCPHYFSLTEEACRGFNTLAKMNPPLRCEKDRLAIIEGLVDGTIDAIATDHAPHYKDEKDVEFDLAPNGIIGFETALALAITYLYHTKKMSMLKLIECMTVKPAGILRLNKGEIKTGAMADITIFDPDMEWTVREDEIISKSKNTPYLEKTLKGMVTETIVAGEVKVKGGKLLV